MSTLKSPLPRSISDSTIDRSSRLSTTEITRSPRPLSKQDSKLTSNFEIELENLNLKKKLAEKEEDCRMAAMVGQSLLSEIERVRRRGRVIHIKMKQDYADIEKQKQEVIKSSSMASLKSVTSHFPLHTTTSREGLFAGTVDHVAHSMDDLSRCSTPEDVDDVVSDYQASPLTSTTPRFASPKPPRTASNRNSLVSDYPPRPSPLLQRRLFQRKSMSRINSTEILDSPSSQQPSVASSESLPRIDPSFAAEIEDVLAQQVRDLHAKLSQSESKRLEYEEKLKHIEKKYLVLKKQYDKKAQYESRMDDRLWEFELANEKLKEELAQSEGHLVKCQGDVRRLNAQITSHLEQIENLKAQETLLNESHEMQQTRMEMDIQKYRRLVLSLQQEKSDLQKQVDELIAHSSVSASKRHDTLPSSESQQEPSTPTRSGTLSQRSSPSKQGQQQHIIMEYQASIYRYEDRIRALEEQSRQSHTELSSLKLDISSREQEIQELQKLLDQAQETIEHLQTDVLNSTLAPGESLDHIPLLALDAKQDTIQAVHRGNQTGQQDDMDVDDAKEMITMQKSDWIHPVDNFTQTQEEVPLYTRVTLRRSPRKPAIGRSKRNATTMKSTSKQDFSYSSTEEVTRDVFTMYTETESLHSEASEDPSSYKSSVIPEATQTSPFKVTKSPVEALTHTIIGSWFQKYNRHGKNPGLRYFWVNPYAKTLHWALKPPSQGKKGALVKKAQIDGIQFDRLAYSNNPKLYPPGPDNIIRIQTPDRTIQLIPTTWSDYECWIKGVEFLLSKFQPLSTQNDVQFINTLKQINKE